MIPPTRPKVPNFERMASAVAATTIEVMMTMLLVSVWSRRTVQSARTACPKQEGDGALRGMAQREKGPNGYRLLTGSD